MVELMSLTLPPHSKSMTERDVLLYDIKRVFELVDFEKGGPFENCVTERTF